MMRKLIIYPNCSKGGVSSVIRGRARHEPNTHFDVLFEKDRGGRHVFDDLNNVSVRIIGQGRMKPYLQYITKTFEYDSVYVLSAPEFANLLAEDEDLGVVYEFHSSNMKIVERELEKLDLDRIGAIHVPSEEMAGWVSERVTPRVQRRIQATPNLVDDVLFSPTGDASFFDSQGSGRHGTIGTPLVWVGRFDRDKGYQYFVRMLAQLPEEFLGVVVVSLEHEPHRLEKFFLECDAVGVRDRVQVYMNLSQEMMSSLYRSARRHSGAFISTSLMESFGYAVAEALSCGLPVAAFDLPVWDRFRESELFSSVPAGETIELSQKVLAATSHELQFRPDS